MAKVCEVPTEISGLYCWTQPEDAENRMSGAVGKVTGKILSPAPSSGLTAYSVHNAGNGSDTNPSRF
jgi:hypothetical protein